MQTSVTIMFDCEGAREEQIGCWEAQPTEEALPSACTFSGSCSMHSSQVIYHHKEAENGSRRTLLENVSTCLKFANAGGVVFQLESNLRKLDATFGTF